MASLYKKPVTTVDPATGKKIKTKSKKWWGKYRDSSGMIRRVPLAADKTRRRNHAQRKGPAGRS